MRQNPATRLVKNRLRFNDRPPQPHQLLLQSMFVLKKPVHHVPPLLPQPVQPLLQPRPLLTRPHHLLQLPLLFTQYLLQFVDGSLVLRDPLGQGTLNRCILFAFLPQLPFHRRFNDWRPTSPGIKTVLERPSRHHTTDRIVLETY